MRVSIPEDNGQEKESLEGCRDVGIQARRDVDEWLPRGKIISLKGGGRKWGKQARKEGQ